MTITFQLDPDLEQALRRDVLDLNVEAKEALLVALYRRGALSHPQLARALGIDRFETEDVLHRHNVTEDLPTAADVLTDVDGLEALRGARR